MKVAGIIALVIGKFSIILSVASCSDPKYSNTIFFINIAFGFACLVLGDYLLNQSFRIKKAVNNEENEKKSRKKLIKIP